MLACFGLFHTRWPEWRPHAPGLLTIAWICGIHAVVFGHSRYHLPLMPLIVMYTAAAVANRAWKPDRSRGYAAALGALAALVFAWGFEVTVRDAERIRNALS